MLFMEPNQTSFDLRWRMFGIEVRVHPMFWLVSLFMGMSALKMGYEYLASWVGCVFLSILIHELGHVWMGQLFGSRGHIVLYGFGGLAIGSSQLEGRWQRIAVFFAGPLAGFTFLGGLYLFLWIWDTDGFPYYLWIASMDLGLPISVEDLALAALPKLTHPLMWSVLSNLVFINLLWGLVNLLPVWPLDGGQITRDLCEGLFPNAGLTQSLGISLVVAGILAVHSFMVVAGRQLLPLSFGDTYTGILFGILALQSFQLMQQTQSQAHWTDDHWDERN